MSVTYIEVATDALRVGIETYDDYPPAIVDLAAAGGPALRTVGAPAVEVLTVDGGHRPPVQLLSHTLAGSLLRYVDHRLIESDGGQQLIMTLRGDGLTVTWEMGLRAGIAALTSSVTVHNDGDAERVLLQVASLSCAVSGTTSRSVVAADDLDVLTGTNDWVGEGRWRNRPLRDEVASLTSAVHEVQQKGGLIARSFGSWPTGRELPIGVLHTREPGLALAWQIEHNGAWRWEVTEDDDLVVWSTSGPTDVDHQWAAATAPGESFRTVPVTLAVAADWESAIGVLTDHRRAIRRPHPDNDRQTLIYNDYMNTLLGDPTTEKLLPLIESAADAGAEVFCIDAGWYDDGSDWWPSVGAWQPSTTRFPDGLGEVVDAIRARGMVPGLWLEPEVVGVRSPVADELPDEAFLLRHGTRVVEAQRFHLDLRHPAARAHLDACVDRLVADLGIGMFKFDYNINPGPGTDHDATSAGAGLLGHQRAVLAWWEGLYERHPDLIIENCSSGAMRSDPATLSRLNLQSTSDQQDSALYAPVAAAAPMLMLPEQAGSWAYPAADMSVEETAATLQAGLLGRLYLSGYLHRLRPEQRELVAEALVTHRALRAEILAGRPRWPLGLPGWGDPVIALAIESPASTLLTVWQRGNTEPVEIPLPSSRTQLEVVFGSGLAGWDPELSGSWLTLQPSGAELAARTYRLM